MHVARFSGTPGFRWSRRCERPAAAPVALFTGEPVSEAAGAVACSYPTGMVGGGGGGIIFPKGPLQLLCCDAPSLLIHQGVAVTGGIFLRIS